MKLPPGHPFSLALPLSFCHLPIPLLRSTQLHPPTWQQEMPALPPTGRQPPPSIKLRTRHGPGTDRRWGGWGSQVVERKKRCFNSALITRAAVDHMSERTGERQAAGPPGLAGPALPQVFTLEPSVCRQTGGMRPEQQWPKLITSAPRRAPGNVPSMPEHLSMRGEKGHNSHKNWLMSEAISHTQDLWAGK